jgi:hypothetical protein
MVPLWLRGLDTSMTECSCNHMNGDAASAESLVAEALQTRLQCTLFALDSAAT